MAIGTREAVSVVGAGVVVDVTGDPAEEVDLRALPEPAGLSLVGGPVISLPEFGDEDVPAELSWQERALCAQTDPEAFFPEKGGSTREAKRVCMSCEVRAECLEYALANDERFGIWGGLSERERRRVKKRAV
jgi:WhiB family redox-sensing transcriptional regulator